MSVRLLVARQGLSICARSPIRQCTRSISTTKYCLTPFCLGSPETNKMVAVEAAINLVGKRKPRILDVASPSGEPAFSIARTLKGATVTVIDGCETSMSNARTALEQHNQANAAKHALPNITFQTADVGGLPDSSFELVTCVSSITEANAMSLLTHFHRVLSSDGALLVGTYEEPEESKLLQLLINTMKAVFGDSVNVSEFLPPSPPHLHKVLSNVGFNDISRANTSEVHYGDGLTVEEAFEQVKANFIRLVPRVASETPADIEAKLSAAFKNQTEALGLVHEGKLKIQPSRVTILSALKSFPKH